MHFFSTFIISISLNILIFGAISLQAGPWDGLFYRLRMYRFQVVDDSGRPVKNARAQFKYRTNFDISGKATPKILSESLTFDKQGRTWRFGLVRYPPFLEDIAGDECYQCSIFHPDTDGEKIILLRKRKPIPMCFGFARIRVPGNWHGELDFSFSRQRIQIPYYHFKDMSEISIHEIIYDSWLAKYSVVSRGVLRKEHYQPDLKIIVTEDRKFIFIFSNGCPMPKFDRHNSFFRGPYEAPEHGYGTVIRRGTGVYACRELIFRYRKQDRRRQNESYMYGIVRNIQAYSSEHRIEIDIEYELNPDGTRNLEGDRKQTIKKQYQNEWSNIQKIDPAAVLKKEYPTRPEQKHPAAARNTLSF